MPKFVSRIYLFVTLLLSTLTLQSISYASINGISDRVYLNKLQGAWLGKCIGGAVGMPLEGWNYKDIEKKFPAIDGYTGYFTYYQVGWSGIIETVTIPKDDEWRHCNVRLRVPAHDELNTHPSLVIGMSFEYSKEPMAWEMRNIRILRPTNAIVFSSDNWKPVLGCYWAGKDQINMDYHGERSLLKLAPGLSKNLNLSKDDEMLISFDARWKSGDNRIGLSFDYMTNSNRKGFGPDDDTSYQIVGLDTLETYGPDISSGMIAKQWAEHVPNDIPEYLAEGLALKRIKSGIMPPASGEHLIGEAIGGQMKGEIWGQICPGRPDLAAEYGRRDGVVAHCKNGVYGEQFVAAMMSAAFKEKSTRKLVDIGLAHIPDDSQYAKVVGGIADKFDKGIDWRSVRNDLIAEYPNMCDPVYADAGVIAIAILYGQGDFEKTVSIAASCGSDTDCNTATAGALVGCIIGADAIPMKWKEPIDNQFKCFAIGLENWKITDLCRRIQTAAKKVMKHHNTGIRFTTGI